MANFRVHRVRFFEYQPKAIQCLAYNNISGRLALLRVDGSVEVWSIDDDWYQEKVISAAEGESTEAITWCEGRLFSASLNAQVIEYDLNTLKKLRWAASNAGAVWCITNNSSNTQLAAGTEDGCVVLFDLSNNHLKYERSFEKQEGRILTLAWHRSEDFIATGGIDNIRVWSVEAGHAIQRLTVPRQNKNKETIVWSITLLEDMTIVSGDSQGKTSFWNGRHGTLTKSYKSHQADVLVVCANEDGTAVNSGGIDPQVVQFRLMKAKKGGGCEWVPSRTHHYHTHDVRAMAFINSHLVSGGVDTTMVYCRYADKFSQECIKFSSIPHTPLAHVAKSARMVLFNYSRYLELWTLGHTTHTSEKDGEILPSQSQPMKLLQLNARSETCIVHAAVSHDARMLAYCDRSSVKVYAVVLDKTHDPPTISLIKLKDLHEKVRALKLAFHPHGHLLVTIMSNGQMHLLDVSGECINVLDTCRPPSESSEPHLLAVSPNGCHVATGDHSNDVHLYSLEKNRRLQFCGSLPRYSCQPTALAFNHKSLKIVVTYTNNKILEYGVNNLRFTKWCKRTINSYHPQWLARSTTLRHVTFSADNPHQIIVHDDESFCVLDKRQSFPDPGKHFSLTTHDDGRENAFHICDKYKYLLLVETLDDDWLVVVERPPITISQSLPPTLLIKKFGM